MKKRGKVLYDDLIAGYIAETDEGYIFSYHPGYLARPASRPVSLTLPLTDKPYSSKVLFPFFDGLIPEGWLLNLVADHWKIRPNDRFELLLLACRDTIGAVSVVPDNDETI